MRTANTASFQIYEAFIAENVGPCLGANGYRRTRRSTVNRFTSVRGDAHFRISCLYHGDPPHDQGHMSMVAFVGSRSLAEFLLASPIGEAVRLKDPPGVGGDVTYLVFGQWAPGWAILPNTDVAAMGRHLVPVLESTVIPFLENHSRLDAMITFWERGPESHPFVSVDHMYLLAAAHWIQGHPDRARAYLADLINGNNPNYDGYLDRSVDVARLRAFDRFLAKAGKGSHR